MTNSRNKGSAFERLVAKELLLRLGITFKRDLDQYRQKDRGDLIADDDAWPFLIECKHANIPSRGTWRQQAVTAAREARKVPCVIWRKTGGPISVDVPLSALCVKWPETEWATVTLDGFCFIARELMAEASWVPNDYRTLRDEIVGEAAE